MSIVAFAVVYIALAGAVASWIAGAYFYARTLKALGGAPREVWYAVAFWPFTRGRLQGSTEEEAAMVNKALVAFIACLLVAFAATAAATNLQRLARVK
ncbi:MAG: hypothetical protein JWN71_975 [Xanthobacteraceae bacterium]|nr:hypothetical protein [Xanthobacteraceae bacterium]